MTTRILTAKVNGSRGGKATARRYDLPTRQKWGENAGGTTLARYGKDYYRHIRIARTWCLHCGHAVYKGACLYCGSTHTTTNKAEVRNLRERPAGKWWAQARCQLCSPTKKQQRRSIIRERGFLRPREIERLFSKTHSDTDN